MTTTTANKAILALFADIIGTREVTPHEDGDIVATLVEHEGALRIEITTPSKQAYDEAVADTLEIEDAIKGVLDGLVDVTSTMTLRWAEQYADVEIEIETRTTPRSGDGGGIRYVVSSTSAEIEIREAGSRADVDVSIIAEARAGESVTGYDYDDVVDDQCEQDARDALIRLGDAIGI